MAKIVGDIAIAVEAETAGLISGLNSGKVSVADFGVKVQQMGKRLSVAEAKSRSFGGAFRNLGGVSRQTRAQIQNTSFQLQDIAVQLQGGTRASTVFAQQLPQLAGAFGPVGAIIGVLAGVGIPALAFAFKDLGNNADELVTKMDEVAKAKTRLNEQLRQGRLGVSPEELTLLDAIAAKITEVGELQESYDAKRGGHNKRNAKIRLDAAQIEMSSLREQLSTLRTLQDAKARLISSTRDMSAAERQLGEQMGATGRELAENERIAELLRQGLSASAIEALQLAGVDMVTGVDAAAEAAARLAANLNISLKEALKLKALSADPLDPFGGAGPFIPTDSPAWDASDTISTNRSGGGGGGGGGSAGPSEAGLEALRKRYATGQELLDTDYQTTLGKLEEYRLAKMVKDGEFNDLEARVKSDHLDKMEKLERDKQSARLQAIGGAFSDLSSLMQTGNAKLFKVGQAAAVAEAVVSGYGAAVSAWEKGMKVGGPPVAAAFTAASLAKTGALISSISSASSTGGSAGGVAGSASTSESAPEVRETQFAEVRLIGDVFSGQSIIDLINDAQDQGYDLRIAS